MAAFARLLPSLLVLLITGTAAHAQLPDLFYLSMNEGAGLTTANTASPGIPGPTPLFSDPSSWNTTDPYLGAAAFRPATPGLSQLNIGAGFATAGGDYTIEFAVRPRSSPGTAPLQYLLGGPNANSLRIALEEFSPGDCQLVVRVGPGEVRCRRSLRMGEWTYVSIVFDDTGNEIRFHFDGVLVDGFGVWTPLALPSVAPWTLGFSPFDPSLPFQGDLDEFRLWGSVRSEAQIHMMHATEIWPLDLGAGRLLTPSSPTAPLQFLSAAETVSFEVLNGGTATLLQGMLLALTLAVDGSPVTTEFILLPMPFAPGSSFTHSFATAVDLSAIGPHEVRVAVNLAGDYQPLNDARTYELRGGGGDLVQDFPWYEDFAAPLANQSTNVPSGWANSASGEIPWLARTAFSAGSGGPGAGVVPGGLFMGAQTDTGWPAGASSSLTTCPIDLTGLVNPSLSFWYSTAMGSAAGPGGTPPTLAIDVIELHPISTTTMSGFVPTTQFASVSGGWERKVVDLGALGDKVVRLVFRATTHDGLVGIDQIAVSHRGQGLSGQAPRAGLAVLELQDPTFGPLSCETSVHEPLSSGSPGPYLLRHRAGLTPYLTLTVTAAPNQPLLFLRGVPNPAAATFAAVGQLDIGGAVDPASGLPAYLGVVGNGFAPQFYPDQYCFTHSAGQLVALVAAPVAFPGWSYGLQVLAGNPNPPFVLLTNAVYGRYE